jgi:hypothetical protein
MKRLHAPIPGGTKALISRPTLQSPRRSIVDGHNPPIGRFQALWGGVLKASDGPSPIPYGVRPKNPPCGRSGLVSDAPDHVR